ncbi:MAG: mannose-6-phosphate isomerase, class I [Anaerolineae bacterium]|nr:mannose-6-phosphate isomerase, class I [Anaerolineae bacterium]
MQRDIRLMARPYHMQNGIQPYSWGARGKAAFIPRLLGVDPEGDEPYAELWIGAHPTVPSHVLLDDGRVPLDQLIARYPETILGEAVVARFGRQLPFLFKVLSAAEPLSIQAHPDREQGRQLHQRDPEHYPDANHKPEVAIALDSLTALVGFRPVQDLADVLQRYAGIREFVGAGVAEQLNSAVDADSAGRRDAVRRLVTALLRGAQLEPESLEQAVQKTAAQLDKLSDLEEAEALFMEVLDSYGARDVGVVYVLLLNLVHLDAGEGLYIPAGIPHAYVQGNIVECMANSDNVVRVGLTQKFKDAEALIDILTYDEGPVNILQGHSIAHGTVYPTSASEFELARLSLAAGETFVLDSGIGPQVFLVLRGQVLAEWANRESAGADCYGQGESMLVPAAADGVRLTAQRPADMYRVVVPVE